MDWYGWVWMGINGSLGGVREGVKNLNASFTVRLTVGLCEIALFVIVPLSICSLFTIFLFCSASRSLICK